MLKQQFFPHQLSHRRAAPSGFATRSTLVLAQEGLPELAVDP